MVYAFIIHSIETNFNVQPPPSPQQQQQQQSIIYLSQFYTSEGNNKDYIKRQNSIIEKVIKDHSFKFQCENTKPDEKQFPDWAFSYSQRNNVNFVDIRGENSSKEGIFRIIPNKHSSLKNDDTFSDPSNYVTTPKYCIWKKILGVCFTIVCEDDENRLLASNFLTLFSNVIVDVFKTTITKTINPMDILPRSEEILLLLNSYLPNGQLLFISNQFSKQIKTNIQQLSQS
ncbi:hypothetical protein RB653_009687 [Dictyostelium firmibasis]|uniref:Uncharacterized protein n=1 Tax=Dictyostelium firmibasis TaxID=79012 RepID=A0AAN7TIY2_9MYCE